MLFDTTPSGLADKGNSLKIGGRARTGIPVVVNNNERVDAFFDEFGTQAIKLVSPVTGGDVTTPAAADGKANPTLALDVNAHPYAWDELNAVWDRVRHGFRSTPLGSALRIGSTSTPTQRGYSFRGLYILINVTARTVGLGPSMRVDLNVVDSAGNNRPIHAGTAFDPTVNLHLIKYYPSALNLAGGVIHRDSVNLALPPIFQIAFVHVADITDITYVVDFFWLP